MLPSICTGCAQLLLVEAGIGCWLAIVKRWAINDGRQCRRVLIDRAAPCGAVRWHSLLGLYGNQPCCVAFCPSCK